MVSWSKSKSRYFFDKKWKNNFHIVQIFTKNVNQLEEGTVVPRCKK